MQTTDLLNHATDLPVLPQSAIMLLRLLADPEGNADDVVRVVQTDGVLCAKLLRICNSPVFGFQKSVDSVAQAILTVGFAEVQRLAMALCFAGTMNQGLAGYGIEGERFWLHSLLVGLGAEALAGSLPRFKKDASAVYTAGLLHDIGKLVLNRLLVPETSASIRNLIEKESYSGCDAERQILGVDHAEIGASLLEKWGLPASLVEAVRNHHRPVHQPQPGFSVFVHMADSMAHRFGSSPGWAASPVLLDEAAANSVGLDGAHRQQALMSVLVQIDKAHQFAVAA